MKFQKGKKRKDELIQDIILFEHDPENLEIGLSSKEIMGIHAGNKRR